MSTVAVIIAVRNMADTLDRAVTSAAQADEIHVVDDASTDNIGEVLARLPVKVIYWRWPVKSRDHNAALRTVYHASKCRHFIGLGADDFLLPTLIPAVRESADAPVIFSDYSVVDKGGTVIGVVQQGVSENTALTSDEARARFQSDRNATESGVGSSLRSDVADWLWDRRWEAMGAYMDAIGYAAAAATFGCLLLPLVGAASTYRSDSYGRASVELKEERIKKARTCRDWLEIAAGVDDATTRSLCWKRCQARW
jgi:hypothetical protein